MASRSPQPSAPYHQDYMRVFSVDHAVRATLLEQGVRGPAGSATLSVPVYDGRPSRNDILVSADSAERLAACLAELRARFAAEIASRRRDYTHFVSVPVPGAGPLYVALRDSVMLDEAAAACAGLDPSVWVSPASLHLTVVMLKLYSGEARRLACEVLQAVQDEVQALRGERPLRVSVRGLRLMKGDPAAAHVLYAGIRGALPEPDPDGNSDQGRDAGASVDTLQRICAVVMRAFAAAGLVPQHDVRDVKLHLTLINTRYRKPQRDPSPAPSRDRTLAVPALNEDQSASAPSRPVASTDRHARIQDGGSQQGIAGTASGAAADSRVSGIIMGAQDAARRQESTDILVPHSNFTRQPRVARQMSPRPGGWQARQPFDARSLLAQHGDLDFGVHELAEMHLSQRQLQPGKHYTVLDVIDM